MLKNLLLLYCYIALILPGCLHAQDFGGLNQGGTKQKNYFTSIPYKEVKSKVIVECTIQGRTYHFIVDTGAGMSITPKVFNELHPAVMSKVAVSDQAGIVDDLQIVALQDIKLGSVVFNNIPTVVVKDATIFDCFGVDGLIGSNLLRNSIVQFSSKTHLLTLTDDAKKLALNKKYASAMQLTSVQSNPYVWIELSNGKNKGRDHVLFDSGMDSFYDLSMKAYQTVFEPINLFELQSEAVGSFTYGLNGTPEDENYYKVTAPQLLLNGITFKDITTETTYGESSRIGADLFKYGVVTLDYKNKAFYFEPYKTGAVDLEVTDWPFTPTVKNNKLVVGIVWGKLWNNIILPGDEILQFDGKTYEGVDVCSMLTKSHKSTSQMAKLVLRDVNTGEIKELEVSKED